MNKILISFAALLLSGCATIVSGTSQTIAVSSTPQGASCSVDRAGARLGAIPSTPGILNISKSGSPLNVTCSRPGYQTSVAGADASFNGWTFGNLVVGGLIGVVVDASTGANFDYPRTVDVPMQPDPAAGPMISQGVAPGYATPATMAPRMLMTMHAMGQPANSPNKRAFLRGACSAGDMSACILADAEQPSGSAKRTRRN